MSFKEPGYYEYENSKVDELIGKTVTTIDHNDEYLKFHTEEETYLMYHRQDCCEEVRLEEIIGDLNDLIDSPILMAEEVTKNSRDEWGNSETWTFYKFATIKGYVTLRWFGESNGYYSESVDFVKLIAKEQ